MSRRGRGIGGMSKAVMEQLSSAKNEFGKDLNVLPPETFPPLMFRPVRNPEEGNQEYSYTLMVKKELHEYYQNSEYYVTLDTKKPDIERYSDRFNILNNNTPKLHIDLSRYPKELRVEQRSVNKKKRKLQKGQPEVNIKCAKLNNHVKDVDIKKKLEELEIKENVGDDGEKKEDKDESLIEEEEEEDIDAEMDEGTDYINSYFDDGENFADEDDALEEGGVF